MRARQNTAVRTISSVGISRKTRFKTYLNISILLLKIPEIAKASSRSTVPLSIKHYRINRNCVSTNFYCKFRQIFFPVRRLQKKRRTTLSTCRKQYVCWKQSTNLQYFMERQSPYKLVRHLQKGWPTGSAHNLTQIRALATGIFVWTEKKRSLCMTSFPTGLVHENVLQILLLIISLCLKAFRLVCKSTSP